MAKRKPKRPLPPEPEVIQDLSVIWVYFTRHTLLYPIPWAVKWTSVEAINDLKTPLKDVKKIIFAKKRR